jgi:hypothetical protein
VANAHTHEQNNCFTYGSLGQKNIDSGQKPAHVPDYGGLPKIDREI